MKVYPDFTQLRLILSLLRGVGYHEGLPNIAKSHVLFDPLSRSRSLVHQ
jgi:hypothetical protein